MKIYRLSFPLPLETVPIEHGEDVVDRILTQEMLSELESQYDFVQHLGGGMWGIAFLTSDGKVVKITHDKAEYNVAKDLVGHGLLSVVDFHEARGLGRNLFLIVKDKVRPLSEYESNQFSYFTGEMDSDLDKVPEEWKSEMGLFEKFDEYINTILNYGFEDTMNPNNIGWDQYGSLVCFDPRASSFQ